MKILNVSELGPPYRECFCNSGYSGSGIGINGCSLVGATNSTEGACASTPCGRYGSCVPNSFTNYTCICTSNYIGRNCEVLDECTILNSPCLNDGVCMNTENGMVCNCSAMYHGSRCQYEKEGKSPFH